MADLSTIIINGKEYSFKDNYSRTNKVDKETGKALMPDDLLDANGNVSFAHLPDIIVSQMIYGGTVNATNVATLSSNAKTKFSSISSGVSYRI